MYNHLNNAKQSVILFLVLTFLRPVVSAQEDTMATKAFLFANQQITSINSSREYVVVLNNLLSHPEYFKYRDYMDMLAWWYSYCGLPEKAVETEDRIFPKNRQRPGFNATDYAAFDALQYITNKADSHKVIMINEEHRMQRHRILTLQLLQPLFKKGFRYLAIETLGYDSSFRRLGYPLLQSGTYSKDPVFGQLIRTAIQLGYTLIPYEVNVFPPGYKTMNSIKRQVFREESQARNIINQTIAIDPGAKVLVHGGRDHIGEVYDLQMMGNDSVRVGMMAGAFKSFSQIDPLTIDQLRHAEHSDSSFSSTVFTLSNKLLQLGEANVLRKNKTGEVLRDESQLYDAVIIPSATRYVSGRPDWLLKLPDRKLKYFATGSFQPANNTYFMVQAIAEQEDPELAVPVDQFAYMRGTRTVLLVLPKGLYQIRVLNDKGEVIYSKRKVRI